MHEDHDSKMDARALGMAKRESLARRRRSLRRRVAGSVAVVFVAAWVAVFGQSYLQSSTGTGATSSAATPASPTLIDAGNGTVYVSPTEEGDDGESGTAVVPQQSVPAPASTPAPAPVAPAPPVTTSQS